MIPIIIAARIVKITVPTAVYTIVAVIVRFLLFKSSASIKNLNIDSSISSVIIGSKNTDNVTKKSYVPNSSVDSFAVYNGNNRNDTICVLSLPMAIIAVFFNSCFL